MIDPERFNPLKVLRWQETIAGAIQGRRVGPVRANLDLTNLCNHNCEWCEPLEYREHSIEESKHTLQTNVALDAIEDLGMLGTKAVFLSGGGEPTLHKQFATIVRACRERGMRVLVTTNGSRLHLLQTVFAESVDAFRVSLDASTEAEHMAIHGSKAGEFNAPPRSAAETARRQGGASRPRRLDAIREDLDLYVGSDGLLPLRLQFLGSQGAGRARR